MPRARRRIRKKSNRQDRKGTLRLAAVFALLVGVNVYVFFFSSGSLKKVSQAAQAASTHAPEPLGAPDVSVSVPAKAAVPAMHKAAVPVVPVVAVGPASVIKEDVDGAPKQPVIPAPVHAETVAPAVNPPAGNASASTTAPRSVRHASSGSVRDHDSLGTILHREGLTPSESDQVIRALRPVMDFKREIHPGEKYALRFDDQGRLDAFELKGSGPNDFVVGRDANGKLEGKKLAH